MDISGAIKAIAVLLTLLILAAAGWWISGLRADLAVRENNEKSLRDSINQQKETLDRLQADQSRIAAANAELSATMRSQNRDLDDLRGRFNTNARGESRDFGKTAAARPQLVERAVNRGTTNALRCLEIASGAALTEQELKATQTNEINNQCPSIANPNYKPAPGR
jgi:chromosome segregation ATPase